MKISNRVLLAFIVVIAVAVTVMAFTSRMYISSIFDHYVEGYRSVIREQWEYVFKAYYLYTGGWEGVENILVIWPKGRAFFTPQDMGRVTFHGVLPGEGLLLADEEGRVVLDSLNERTGEALPPRILEQGTPLILDGEQVVTLIMQHRAARTVMTL